MLSIFLILFFLPPAPDDKRAIRGAVKAFSQAVARSDWTGTTIGGERGGRPIWPETTPPLLEAGGVCLIAQGVALVDATASQYGSLMIVRRAPGLLILSKARDGWRIVAWLPVALPREQRFTPE